MKIFPGSFAVWAAVMISAGIFFFPAEVRCAENTGSEDLLQGDKAFAAGDYTAAAGFYRKAAVLLGSPLREKCLLQLCRTYLKQGEITAAVHELEQFKKQYPKASAGLLPGLVYAAEGNTQKAVEEFKKLIASNTPERLEALYQLGAVYLANRSWQEALTVFDELAASPIPEAARRGVQGKVYALIQSGKNKEAAALLEKMSASPVAEQLKLLNMVQSGDLDAFKKIWLEVRKNNGDPRPEKLLYELCGKAAVLAESKKETEFAILCLKDCYDFAPGDAERKDLMHRLFNLQSRQDVQGAVETVNLYCERFPDAADRALLMLQCGRLLAANGKNKEAVNVFLEVIRDEDNLLDERRSAAFDAAQAAEKEGQHEVARRMHRYLISRSTTPVQKQTAEFNCGEYFVRRKNYAQAESCFNRVISQGGDMADRARYSLLTAQISARQYAKAKETAARLAKSAVPQYADMARYRLAELAEQEKKYAQARELYLACQKAAKDPELASGAAFSAARLAEQMNELSTAAREYILFAQKYPQNVNAPAALFLALRSYCTERKTSSAQESLFLLEKKYATTPECGAAMLQLADYYFNRKENKAALALLDRGEKRYQGEIRASFMLLKSRVLLASGNAVSALETAKKLLTDHPESREVSETRLLCGNILSDLGENLLALKYFRQAEKTDPPRLAGEVISGRIADCLTELFSGNVFERKYIDEALKRYLTLGSSAIHEAVKLQSLYKAGSCYELAGNPRQAAEYYEKALYFAAALKSRGGAPDPVWCARAAYAGAQAALKSRRPERLIRAMRMIRLYEELNLPRTGEDFKTLRRNLRESYNLIKRKGI